MNVIIMGKPGSGKGVQAEVIAKHYHLQHISTGELFRNELNQDTEFSKKIKDFMGSGNLVSDEITNELVKNVMEDLHHKDFILDGYPRNKIQLDFFDTVMKDVDHVALLDVSDDAVLKRMRLRQKINPRIENKSEENLKKRLNTFRSFTQVVVDAYKARGLLRVINGDQSIEDVTKDIIAALG